MSTEKIIIAASAATVCAVGIAAVTVFLCRRLFEKNYFTVSDSTNY